MRTPRLSLIVLLAVFCSFWWFNGSAAEPNDYLPLNVGDEWTMDATIISPMGVITKSTAHRKVLAVVERDQKKYFRCETVMDGGPLAGKPLLKLVRKDENGFYSIEENDKKGAEQMEIQFPLVAGAKWTRTMEGRELKDTVIGAEDVVIGGKKYENCFHIRSTTPDSSFQEDFWEAPIIGCVKSLMKWANGARISITIREFKPGKR